MKRALLRLAETTLLSIQDRTVAALVWIDTHHPDRNTDETISEFQEFSLKAADTAAMERRDVYANHVHLPRREGWTRSARP